MGKLYRIAAAPGPDGPGDIEEAIELSEKSGSAVLMVPVKELCLTVDSGTPVVVVHGKN